MVEKDSIRRGAAFRFEDGNRRVVSIEHGQVQWVYADGIKRMEQAGGSERIKYFAKDAIEEYQESHADIARAAFFSRISSSEAFTGRIVVIIVVIVLFAVLMFRH